MKDLTTLNSDLCVSRALFYKSKKFKKIFMYKNNLIISLDFLVKIYEKYLYDTQEIIKLHNNFLKTISIYCKVIDSALKEYV
jgi:hypothetical protein